MRLIVIALALLAILSGCGSRVRHGISCTFDPPYYLAFGERGEKIIVPTRHCIEYDYYCGTDPKLDEEHGCNIKRQDHE